MTIVDEPSDLRGGYTLSSICATLGRAQTLTGVFRDVLTKHFSRADWIEDPRLRALIWRAETSTQVLIETSHRWTPESAKQRPAVIIKRNAFAAEYKGLGAGISQGQTVDEFGDPHYQLLWTGSYTFFCLSSEGAAAELLAEEVKRELAQFAPVIQASLGLMALRVVQLGELARLEEALETFVIPVTVAVAYEERWKLVQQAPRLQGISLKKLCE